jgi:rhomboid protease GluP
VIEYNRRMADATDDERAEARLDSELASTKLDRLDAAPAITPMPQDPPPRPAVHEAYVPYVTIALAAANVIVFFACAFGGNDPMHPTADAMYHLGGNFGPATLNGEWWRLLSSMFLHYGALHIAMNMVGLVDGGRHVERMYGRVAFLSIYMFAGLAGGLASALPGKAVSAGASGAIFGIFGAFGAFLLRHRGTLHADEVKKQARGLLVFLAANIVFGLQEKGIDMFAHVGGLAAGFVAGLVLTEPRGRLTRAILVGVVGCGAVIAATYVVPKPTSLVFLGSTKTALERFGQLESTALERFNTMVKEPDTTDDGMAKVIENEILPTWREAMEALSGLEAAPPDFERRLRDYADMREHALVDIAQGLRAHDDERVKSAMTRMREAGEAAAKMVPK